MNDEDRQRGAALIRQWQANYSHLPVIPDADLQGGIELLDEWVTALRRCYAGGGVPSVEALALRLLSDVAPHRETRLALLLALAMTRLASS